MTATAQAATRSSSHTAAFGLLLGMAAFTVLWLGLNSFVPQLQTTGLSATLTRLLIHAAVLTGIWLGLERTALPRGRRVRVWMALALPFTAWLAAVWALALHGAFVPRQAPTPALPLAIFLPVIVALLPLLRSRRVGELLDATPAAWLIALQAYRVGGGIFLIGWARGLLSGAFALPAGTGDVLVGLLAVPVAYYVSTGSRAGRMLGYAWNVLGLIDLTVAVGMGILTAPGPLQLFPPDRPNLLLGAYPSVMIPAFAVPSSVLFHALSLRQLARSGRRAVS